VGPASRHAISGDQMH